MFLSPWGNRAFSGFRGYGYGRAGDLAYDLRLRNNPAYARLQREAAVMAPLRVHVAAVEVPSRRDDLQRLFGRLGETRHHITTSVAPMADRGKFDNLNHALADIDLSAVDWLILTDDDIIVPDRFLDLFLCACERASLKAAMPAHRFHSYAAWAVTMRHWNSLVRETRYVETGPLTAFRADMLPHVVPFPVTRWAWGVDLLWSEIARERRWPIGVVDATPVRHYRPVSASYDRNLAVDEALTLLREKRIEPDNREFLRTVRTHRRFGRPAVAV